jgi:hypothetical protein
MFPLFAVDVGYPTSNRLHCPIRLLAEASLQVFGKASHELIRGLVSLAAAN